MTARTRHGSKAHRSAHGSDEGSAHHKLNRMHAQPNRPEGSPMSAATMPSPTMGMPAPPQPQDNTPMAPPGAMAGGSMDPEEGDQT